MLFGLILIASCVTSCTTGNSRAGPCPPIRDYTEAQQKQMAAELDLLPEDSVIIEAMKDYSELRDRIRKCR